MKSPWPEVELGEVIKQRKESITLEDEKTYQRVTVKLYSKGIEPRDNVNGREIKTKTQFIIRERDFLVAEIDAKVGGYGVVPKSLDGAIVSGHYFTYEVDSGQLNPHFLKYWLKTPSPLNQIKQFIRGSLNYAAIRPKHFPQVKISLPPIEEQQRIVGVIDHIATKIEKAGKLQNIIDYSQEELLHSIYEATTKAMCKEVSLRDILIQDKSQIAIKDNQEYKQVTVAMHGKGVRLRKRISGSDIKTKNQYLIRSGQFIYSRIDARNGAIGIVPKELDGAIVTGDFPTFNINQEIILPEILEIIIISKKFVNACRLASRGVTNRRRLKEDQFLSIETFIPYPDEQQKIVALKKRVDAMKRVQSQTAAELESLMPAVLDRAFKGEL